MCEITKPKKYFTLTTIIDINYKNFIAIFVSGPLDLWTVIKAMKKLAGGNIPNGKYIKRK